MPWTSNPTQAYEDEEEDEDRNVRMIDWLFSTYPEVG
jgi:hypothetical protein